MLFYNFTKNRIKTKKPKKKNQNQISMESESKKENKNSNNNSSNNTKTIAELRQEWKEKIETFAKKLQEMEPKCEAFGDFIAYDTEATLEDFETVANSVGLNFIIVSKTKKIRMHSPFEGYFNLVGSKKKDKTGNGYLFCFKFNEEKEKVKSLKKEERESIRKSKVVETWENFKEKQLAIILENDPKGEWKNDNNYAVTIGSGKPFIPMPYFLQIFEKNADPKVVFEEYKKELEKHAAQKPKKLDELEKKLLSATAVKKEDEKKNVNDTTSSSSKKHAHESSSSDSDSSSSEDEKKKKKSKSHKKEKKEKKEKKRHHKKEKKSTHDSTNENALEFITVNNKKSQKEQKQQQQNFVPIPNFDNAGANNSASNMQVALSTNSALIPVPNFQTATSDFGHPAGTQIIQNFQNGMISMVEKIGNMAAATFTKWQEEVEKKSQLEKELCKKEIQVANLQHENRIMFESTRAALFSEELKKQGKNPEALLPSFLQITNHVIEKQNNSSVNKNNNNSNNLAESVSLVKTQSEKSKTITKSNSNNNNNNNNNMIVEEQEEIIQQSGGFVPNTISLEKPLEIEELQKIVFQSELTNEKTKGKEEEKENQMDDVHPHANFNKNDLENEDEEEFPTKVVDRQKEIFKLATEKKGKTSAEKLPGPLPVRTKNVSLAPLVNSHSSSTTTTSEKKKNNIFVSNLPPRSLQQKPAAMDD